MANWVNFIRDEVEPYVRKELKRKYKRSFKDKAENWKLIPGGTHKFDAVAGSHNEMIVVNIKSHVLLGKSIPDGQFKRCLADLYYLSLAKAKWRVLVLTNEEFYNNFRKRMVGKIPKGIDLIPIKLPKEMQDKARRLHNKSKTEMLRRGSPAKGRKQEKQ